jgi:hypothetical protein
MAALSLFLSVQADGSDLAKPLRKIPKSPAFVASEPLYGVFVFGTNGATPVWAVLDKSSRDAGVFDVLYLDLNADGDLTQGPERWVAKTATASSNDANAVFEIGRFNEPGTDREHTEFTITWRPHRVSYRMKWLGAKMTMGGYGSEPDQYGNFSTSPQTAPMFIPGHDRPFQFLHWMSGVLKRGQANDFKVFMGNAGEGSGTFCAVDNQFLPPSDYVVATLICRDSSGNQNETQFDLKSRC